MQDGRLPRSVGGSFVESLERRTLLAAAYFKHLGPLDGRSLPAASTLPTTVGHRFNFSASAMRAQLPASSGSPARVISLPTPDGGTVRLRVSRSNLLAPDVAAANDGIRTYSAVGVDDPSLTATLDLSVNGLHATFLTADGSWSIAPLVERTRDVVSGGGEYLAFDSNDVRPTAPLACKVDESHEEHLHELGHDDEGLSDVTLAATGPTRITVRIAVAATGEWVADAGGTASSALAAIVSSVNYAQAIFNRDLNVGFTLVSGTNLIYLDPATDPYTNTDSIAMLGQNQTNVDGVIGTANYDVGHVFGTEGGGVAYVAAVGSPGSKAAGYSGVTPGFTGGSYVFAHEMGHQFGSHHTFNNAGEGTQRSAPDAYEPGSGSTIMGYGGSAAFSSAPNDYFHARSIEAITHYLSSGTYGAVVGTRTNTGNAAPVVNAGANKTIPALTPFELAGSATDDNGGLTYAWEQYDLGDGDALGIDDGDGPLFRSRRFASSPTRSFPEIGDVVDGRTDDDEFLPQVSRSADPLTFRLTVRDGLGGVGSDDVDLVVQATGSAFALTSQNAAGITWGLGSTQTITWNVAGTTAAAFDAANVAVLISYDNGATFTPLLASTPNTGSATITVPLTGTATSAARIKIKPLNNVFYDINNAPIVIFDPTVSAVPGAPDLAASTDSGSSTSDNLTNRDNSTTAKNLQFTVGGVVSGATISLYSGNLFLGSAVASGTSVTVTTNGTVDLTDGVRSITARQTQVGKTQSAHSASLAVTIDTVGPGLVGGTGVLEYEAVKPGLTFTYDTSITFGDGSANVTRTTPPTGSVGLVRTSVSGTVSEIDFLDAPDGVLSDGWYTATLMADRYRDRAGNPSAATTLNFFVLAGDANRDRTVNFADLVILAKNYNQSGKTFSQGNFNYSSDGKVDFSDLVILSQRYNTSVAPPAVVAASFVTGRTKAAPRGNRSMLSELS